MTTPTFTLSRADSDRRVNDFPCPEGDNSARWTINVAGTTDEFIANWEPAAGHESFITSINFTAYGEKAHTKAGALASLKKMMRVYFETFTQYRALLTKRSPVCYSHGEFGYFYENTASEIDNALVAIFISVWKGDERMSFGIDELDVVDQYRDILNGTCKFVYALLKGDGAFTSYVDEDGAERELGDYSFFEDFDDLMKWTRSLK